MMYPVELKDEKFQQLLDEYRTMVRRHSTPADFMYRLLHQPDIKTLFSQKPLNAGPFVYKPESNDLPDSLIKPKNVDNIYKHRFVPTTQAVMEYSEGTKEPYKEGLIKGYHPNWGVEMDRQGRAGKATAKGKEPAKGKKPPGQASPEPSQGPQGPGEQGEQEPTTEIRPELLTMGGRIQPGNDLGAR
jgi:hypothetical protein